MKLKDDIREDKSLGMMFSWIVNGQYYPCRVRDNSKIHIEARPLKRFKDDELEVLNENGRPIGHLRVKDAVYLKPLIEQGKVYVSGHVVYKDEKEGVVHVFLYVTLSRDHLDMLKPLRTRNAESIVHNHILSAYINKERYSLSTISNLGMYYYRMMDEMKILPETKLLYKLTSWKSIYEEQLEPIIKEMKKKLLKHKEEMKDGYPMHET